MKSLETVQKTFKVFQTLTEIAKVFCIVGASICAVTVLCAAVLQNGHVFGIFGEPTEQFIADDFIATCVKLLSTAFMLIVYAVLFGFAHSYLKQEQEDGTPFTEKGAEKLKMLGIRCIYIPIIAVSLSAAIAVWQGVKNIGIAGNFPSAVIGIALIIISIVFRYGAELENKSKTEIL